MKTGYASTAIGLEDLLEDALREKGFRVLPRPEGLRGRVAFAFENLTDLVRVLEIPLLHRLGILIHTETIPPERFLARIKEVCHTIDWREWGLPDVTFAVRAARRGNHPFRSPDVEREAGAGVVEGMTARVRRPRVHLDDPDLIIRVDVGPTHQAAIWVDLVGYESLHRRGYRAYEHPAPMKGTIAAAMLRMMGYTPEKGLLVDPMAGGGTVGIEAAWMALNVPPVFLRRNLLLFRNPIFRELREALEARLAAVRIPEAVPFAIALGDRFARHVEGARQNAERAGVAHLITFYRENVSRFSWRFQNVPFVATNPPYGLRVAYPEEVERVYAAFFREMSRALAAEGRIGLMTPRLDLVRKHAPASGFRILEDRQVFHGKLPIRLIVLGREE